MIRNGIDKIGFRTIGVPKIIGSLIPHIPGNTLKRPIERICFDFDLHINKTSPNVFPAPPINTYLNICKLIIAVGRAKMINSDYVKEGAVVLDVGINRDENNKLCGDVKDKVYAINPVQGGIGPMTITMLLQNTLEAFYHHQGE